MKARCSLRRMVFCLALPTGMAFAALVAPSPVAAQGTTPQRAACEEEGRWLCSNYVPDEEAIKACMLRNLRSLSPRCRAMFGAEARRAARAKR
jgi:hypothetical protein